MKNPSTFLLLIFLVYYSCSTTRDKQHNQRFEIIETAESLLNSPYRYGGKNPKGFDCSGFTQYVYHKAANISLERSSKAQAKQGQKISLTKAKAGDLVFFRKKGRIDHVGIIHKSSRKGIWMIHASSSKGIVSEEITSSKYWSKKLAFAKSYV